MLRLLVWLDGTAEMFKRLDCGKERPFWLGVWDIGVDVGAEVLDVVIGVGDMPKVPVGMERAGATLDPLSRMERRISNRWLEAENSSCRVPPFVVGSDEPDVGQPRSGENDAPGWDDPRVACASHMVTDSKVLSSRIWDGGWGVTMPATSVGSKTSARAQHERLNELRRMLSWDRREISCSGPSAGTGIWPQPPMLPLMSCLLSPESSERSVEARASPDLDEGDPPRRSPSRKSSPGFIRPNRSGMSPVEDEPVVWLSGCISQFQLGAGRFDPWSSQSIMLSPSKSRDANHEPADKSVADPMPMMELESCPRIGWTLWFADDLLSDVPSVSTSASTPPLLSLLLVPEALLDSVVATLIAPPDRERGLTGAVKDRRGGSGLPEEVGSSMER